MSVYIVKISFERRLCNKIRSTWPLYFFCNFKLSYFNYLNAKCKYRRQFKNIVFLQGLDIKKYVTHNLNTIYVTNIRQIGNSFISKLHFIRYPTTTILTTNSKKIKIRQKTYFVIKILETIFVRLFPLSDINVARWW